MFRVSRVEQVDVLEEAAVRPVELDLQAEWQRLRSGLEQNTLAGVDVVVRVRPELEGLVRRVSTPLLIAGSPSATEHMPGDDWVRLRLRFRVREAARGILLGFGGNVEVLEPLDLRADLLRLATEAVALYD
jgi:predicted DNA-binding transcriptional regulator YafY